MKVEHCKIDMSSGNKIAAVCKKPAKTGSLTRNKFDFIPKTCVEIKDSIRALEWDSVKKTIELTMIETPELDVYKWLKAVKDFYAASKMSSFLDINANAANLVFMDGNNSEIAKITFKDLNVISHKITLDKNTLAFGNDAEEPVKYYVVLSYQYEETNIKEVSTKAVDGEWKNPVLKNA